MDRIFIDMDGVLFDFNGAICELFGTTEEELRAKWAPGEWDICGPLGLTDHQFWKALDKEGAKFWAEMKPYPWATKLWKLCKTLAPGRVSILSSPSQHPSAMAGKLEALQRWHYNGKEFRDFLIGPRKDLCANETAFLIDDSNKNIDRFRGAGGNAILFPRYWNEAHELEAHAMAYTRLRLQEEFG